MSAFQPLFSVEEALGRLGQSKSKGCLLIFNARDSIHLFVQEGNIVAASWSDKPGEEALDRAMTLTDSSYRWIADAEPTKPTLRIDIRDYLARRSQAPEARYKTIRMATYQRPEKKFDFQYFFVPEEMPSTKLRLKKATSVAGREANCDLTLDSFQVVAPALRAGDHRPGRAGEGP